MPAGLWRWGLTFLSGAGTQPVDEYSEHDEAQHQRDPKLRIRQFLAYGFFLCGKLTEVNTESFR